jgi:hypothetical protein
MKRSPRLLVVVALVASAAAVLAPGLASGAAAQSGTLTVCSAKGNPPVTTVLAFTLAGPVADGGTQVLTLGPGECRGRYFFGIGSQVSVIENVPTGDAVTSITISGESKLTQTVLGAGVATITIGNADSTVTFTTRGPGAAAPRGCVVPKVVGLTLAAARTAIKRAACRVRTVSHVYSSRIPKGGVTSTNPRHGAHLAHNGGVRVYVSRGRRP